MVWDDSFSIGVEKIDKQHRALFAAVNRISNVFADDDGKRSKRVCIEAIKYLKSYTLQHFSDEEEYQLSINYSGFEQHKRQHESLISAAEALEKELEETDYSLASVKRLEGVLTSWLLYHVMNADQAIVGRITPAADCSGNAAEAVSSVIKRTAMQLFGAEAEISDPDYRGGFSGSELFCIVELKNDKNGGLRFLFAMDEHAVLRMMSGIAGYDIRETDEMIKAAVLQLCADIATRVSAFGEGVFSITKKRVMYYDDAKFYAAAEGALLSMVFTSKLGALAVSINEL